MQSRSRRPGLLLWLCAFVLMAAAAVYQRTTGPTYPHRGAFAIAGVDHRYRLLRSEETTRDARIAVPAAGGAVAGTLCWRRYPTSEPFARLPLQLQAASDGGDSLAADLPRQPAAGKLEYHLELLADGRPLRIPAAADEEIVLRFKDPVPLYWLLPHVLTMFVGMLVGVRAGLAALLQPATVRRYARLTLLLLFVGGLVLGPIVQKHAFGAYWTGWPFGSDLTDDKQLAMWLCWLLAVLALRGGAAPRWRGRLAVLLATAVMIGVYLIPHSLRGSQLDYGRLQPGVDAHEAIESGR